MPPAVEFVLPPTGGDVGGDVAPLGIVVQVVEEEEEVLEEEPVLFFSISASRSIIKLPIPTSHSESSYSKLVVAAAGGADADLFPVAVIEGELVEDEGDDDADVRSVVFVVASGASAPSVPSSPVAAAAAADGADSFIGPPRTEGPRHRRRPPPLPQGEQSSSERGRSNRQRQQ